jgi:hypothetical protein
VTDRVAKALRYAVRAVLLAIAVLYFLIDLIFLSFVRPLRRRLMALKWIRGLRGWVGTLNRYAALLLLVVPWLILEPIKPLGFILFRHKHHLVATLLIIGGELIKLSLFEQLFDMTKPKLMSFPWFARYHNAWQATIDYLRSLLVWRRMLELSRTVRTWVRRRWLAE